MLIINCQSRFPDRMWYSYYRQDACAKTEPSDRHLQFQPNPLPISQPSASLQLTS
ncbi:MAG: hypothetical protein QNJ68_18425 [Microcoleaceae cyanobacterium MO_207.B10]|nr:hypothetical protein [Microcoleaceae cyanobacterium MO_207.B10]